MELAQFDFDILCPISLQIFKDPVIAEDGITYERELIEEWFENNKKSPSTGIEMDNINITSNMFVKNFVNEYLLLRPEEKINQYVCKIKTFEEIKYYKIMDLNMIESTNIVKICSTLKLSELNYLIKNTNFNSELKDKNKLIHFICQSSTPEIITYIIDHYIKNNLDIECINIWGYMPIHYICLNSTPEMIQHIFIIYINNNLNIKYKTINGDYSLIYFVCKYSAQDSIIYILDIYDKNDLYLDYKTPNGNVPILIIENRFSKRSNVYKYIKKLKNKKQKTNWCCMSLFKKSYDLV
jgi:hypothetical protein